jgi:DEAD/DEAH box helicase domain-containing protein
MFSDAFIHHLTSLPDYEQQIVYTQHIPAQEARLGKLDKPLHPKIQSRLAALGIEDLYTHQAIAVNNALAGKNVIVSTASASGKTMCYNLPVLESMLADRTGRALYLFPTKALAQDQLRKLIELACPGIIEPGECATFDGDTPQDERPQIKKKARIVLTNPDMLHIGILPNHESWSKLLGQLKYVVIDEAHVYRGVFGSHVAQVVRRLRRLCRHYGSSPKFILCSATIANPGEHAGKLAGEPFEVIEKDGSSHGGKSFIFWNPPVVDKIKTVRRSSNSEATFIFTELVRKSIRSLVFARTRKLAELICIYTRDHLGPPLSDLIKTYRAGYLAGDRRQIEQDLFSGKLLGAVSTTALELGIDIGDLEATVLTGYPGSISSTWQQAGRSGRSGEKSLSILIAQDNPLDQYIISNPDFFFGRTFENALINLDNINILKPHLQCAAWESPLSEGDQKYFGPAMNPVLQELVNEGAMRKVRNFWYLSPRIAHPAQKVNIRSSSDVYYAILDESHNHEVLETIESGKAFSQVHPGAIYLHQGDAYFIKELDLEKKIALAVPSHEPYYTQIKELTDIKVLKTKYETELRDVKICFGDVEVTSMIVGFRKKKQFTEEIIGDEILDLPPQKFYTEAFWFDLPQKEIDLVAENQLDFAGGLHATEHAAIALLPLFALCDRNDIGGVSTPFHPDTGKPEIFIYDAYPGGIGIAQKGFDIILELWDATLKTIETCPCKDGCPSCIQSPKCGNNNEPLDKKAAVILLKGLLGI